MTITADLRNNINEQFSLTRTMPMAVNFTSTTAADGTKTLDGFAGCYVKSVSYADATIVARFKEKSESILDGATMEIAPKGSDLSNGW
ncbi:hypothetical protein P1P91_08790 [Halomonas piscis]|uniref:Uncharacterized protein n=1 Tax=Halomonas piscis TaxID=3031727 RepID=A0ABY9Z555_9GAMM|nr:hypothetical protein [Halomonas piscis]WNK21568.1 hypothetical protein P1P91_08790 [Halomonas piscis]